VAEGLPQRDWLYWSALCQIFSLLESPPSLRKKLAAGGPAQRRQQGAAHNLPQIVQRVGPARFFQLRQAYGQTFHRYLLAKHQKIPSESIWLGLTTPYRPRTCDSPASQGEGRIGVAVVVRMTSPAPVFFAGWFVERVIAAALLGRASCGNAQNLDAARGADGRALVTSEIEAQTASTASSGLDLNVIAAADVLEMPRRPPKLALEDLDLVISDPKLLPPGVEASPMHSREYPYLAPGMDAPVRVSTDPDY
jgi:hypothetical protein